MCFELYFSIFQGDSGEKGPQGYKGPKGEIVSYGDIQMIKDHVYNKHEVKVYVLGI